MEETQKEADAAAGEAGGGRGWKAGIKLLGLTANPLASALERIKVLARLWEKSIRGGFWKRAADADDAARGRSNPHDGKLLMLLLGFYGHCLTLWSIMTQDGCNREKNGCMTNQIDILKRLQREAFFEIMKLRDRQDKVERALSLYKTSKGSSLHEDSTRLKGLIDVAGALFFAGNDGQEMADILKIAGIRTGIDSRFIFETVTRQKDTLMAEFVAIHDSPGTQGDVPRSPLALSKVLYLANINNRISLIAIPLGARCRDFGFGPNLLQFQGLTESSSFGPSLLNQCLGCAAGLRVRCSNITASVAQAVSRLDMQLFSSTRRCLGTFGQVDFELLAGTRVSLLGIWKMPGSSSRPTRVGTLGALTGVSGPQSGSQAEVEHDSSSLVGGPMGNVSSGSFAMMLESEFDDSSRLRGWVELQKSDLKSLQWALSLSDTPEDEVGWGLTIGGNIGSDRRRVQLESFLKVGLGKKFSLQPGFVYTMDGRTQFPAMVLRACWAL